MEILSVSRLTYTFKIPIGIQRAAFSLTISVTVWENEGHCDFFLC